MDLNEDAVEILDDIVEFDGLNGFLGAGCKPYVVMALRELVVKGHRPDHGDVVAYLSGTGRVYHGGAERVGDWYEAILEGRDLRGHDGRSIR